MKKYLIYTFLVVVLVAVAGWLIYNQSSGTIDEREGDFAVKDESAISRIVLTDTENKKIELTKEATGWKLNNRYDLREDLLKQLMVAITRVTSLSPVPVKAHDHVVRDLVASHVRIEIFDANNKLLKSYWVGGPSVDGKNTFMLLEINGKPAARPHLTYVPGNRGYLTSWYPTDEENWRSRSLFNYTPEAIQSLRVHYPKEPQKSFTITQVAPDSFSVLPADEKFRIHDTYQQKFVKQYLSFFSNISIEAFDNSYSKKDSLRQSVPLCTFTITAKDKSVNEVKLYHMPVNERSKAQFDLNGKDMEFDIDHFYASIHQDQDFAIVQYYVFGKLMRSYRDFYFKPAAQ